MLAGESERHRVHDYAVLLAGLKDEGAEAGLRLLTCTKIMDQVKLRCVPLHRPSGVDDPERSRRLDLEVLWTPLRYAGNALGRSSKCKAHDQPETNGGSV